MAGIYILSIWIYAFIYMAYCFTNIRNHEKKLKSACLEVDLVDASNLMSFPWRWSLLLHGPRSVAVASAAVLSGCCRAGSLGARLQALQVLKHGRYGSMGKWGITG